MKIHISVKDHGNSEAKLHVLEEYITSNKYVGELNEMVKTNIDDYGNDVIPFLQNLFIQSICIA